MKLSSDDQLSQLARNLGLTTWDALLHHIRHLPYGRISLKHDFSLVLREGKGTCSSKHALLKQVADENEIDDVKLVLGMYKMNRIPLFLVFIAFLLISCAREKINTENAGKAVTIGTVELIYSNILQEERELWIHIPGGFYGMNEQVESYPVLYLLDGEIHFKSTVGILDQLSNAANATDLAPPMIVVGIVNTNRTRDLTPMKAVIGRDSSTLDNTGGANKLAEFLESELIPFIEAKYPANQHRTLVGHSFGGLFALYTLIHQPQLFANYLVIDPSMWYADEAFSQEVLTVLPELPFTGQSLYLAMANNRMPWMELSDVRDDTTEIMNQMGSLMRFLDRVDTLQIDGLRMASKYYPTENHGQVPLPAIYDGLRFCYFDYPFPEMPAYYYPGSDQGKKDISTELEDHYRALSERLGYRVLPVESYINAYAYGLHRFDRPEVAKSLFELNVKNYPESANARAAMGNFYFRLGDTTKAVSYYEQALELKEIDYVRERVESLQE